jgi:hypothetical protein
MELNSAQTNAALYALARQVFVLRAEIGVISAALTKAGVIASEHLESAIQGAISQYQDVFDRMKSFPRAGSMEANESVEAYMKFVEMGFAPTALLFPTDGPRYHLPSQASPGVDERGNEPRKHTLGLQP